MNELTRALSIVFKIIFLGLLFSATSQAVVCKDFKIASSSNLKSQPKVTLESIGKIKVSGRQNPEVRFLGTRSALLILSGDFLYKTKISSPGKASFRELKSLTGLDGTIESLNSFSGEIWITKRGVDPSEMPSSSVVSGELLLSQILRSTDQGETFTAVNTLPFRRRIKTQFGEFYEFAPITRIEKMSFGNREGIVINAGVGPSAFVSFDGGKKWQSLISGEQEQWSTIGYEGYFEKIGTQMFFGGEHPMDHAYLKEGKLDGQNKISLLNDVDVPSDLGNRRLQFIRRSPYQSSLLFAGTEGGLLVSRDAGRKWKFSFVEDEFPKPGREKRNYPYIQWLVFPKKNDPKIILVGGQPQIGHGTILISKDAGQSWIDLSNEIVGSNELLGLGQISDGLILIGSRKESDPKSMKSEIEQTIFILKGVENYF